MNNQNTNANGMGGINQNATSNQNVQPLNNGVPIQAAPITPNTEPRPNINSILNEPVGDSVATNTVATMPVTPVQTETQAPNVAPNTVPPVVPNPTPVPQPAQAVPTTNGQVGMPVSPVSPASSVTNENETSTESGEGQPIMPNVGTIDQTVTPTNTIPENNTVPSPTPVSTPVSAPTVETIPNVPPVQAPVVETIPNVVNNNEQVNAIPTPNIELTTQNTVATPSSNLENQMSPVVPTPNNAIGTPTQITQPIENPGMNQTPVPPNGVDPTMGVLNQMPTIEPSINGMSQDDFNAVPVPPVFNEDDKKKKGIKIDKKVIIILLIIILIAAIGFGVYYFLTSAKNTTSSASIVTKDLILELGSTLSQNINDYANISGYDINSCTLDTKNIDVNKVSTYKFYVTCGGTKQEGKAIVDDTSAPVLTLNELTVSPNAVIKADDFVEQCSDNSPCTFSFAEDYSELTKKVGEYEISIIATDAYNNSVQLKTMLIVSNNAPVKYLTCYVENDVDDIYANLKDSYKIGVDTNGNFYNAVRTSKFTFAEASDYEKAASAYDKSKGLNNIIGIETMSKDAKTITIKSNKTLAEIETDVGGTLSTNATILKVFMMSHGYTCN